MVDLGRLASGPGRGPRFHIEKPLVVLCNILNAAEPFRFGRIKVIAP